MQKNVSLLTGTGIAQDKKSKHEHRCKESLKQGVFYNSREQGNTFISMLIT